MGTVTSCCHRPSGHSLERNIVPKSRNNYGYNISHLSSLSNGQCDALGLLSIASSGLRTSSSRRVSIEDFAFLKV